jgi:hypothetical protein
MRVTLHGDVLFSFINHPVMPSLDLNKEDFCCGCHQYDSRSFTAGFLN